LHAVSDDMKLELTRFLAQHGRRFPIELSRPETTDESTDSAHIVSLHVTGEAFAQLGTLYLETAIHAELLLPCGRCLRPVPQALDLEETFEVFIPPGVDVLDLTTEFTDLVLSSYDPNVICRRECRGLCPVCGADLNDEPEHRCDEPQDDRRTLGDFLK